MDVLIGAYLLLHLDAAGREASEVNLVDQLALLRLPAGLLVLRRAEAKVGHCRCVGLSRSKVGMLSMHVDRGIEALEMVLVYRHTL